MLEMEYSRGLGREDIKGGALPQEGNSKEKAWVEQLGPPGSLIFTTHVNYASQFVIHEGITHHEGEA